MSDIQKQLEIAWKEMQALRDKINDLQRRQSGEEVANHNLADTDGNPIKLYDLFGEKSDLIVVHNMGKGCAYCTLWADGFNGTWQHLENRAGFALVMPDDPETVKEFASRRGWNFRIFSNNRGDFTRTMGFENEKGGPMPGVSTFYRDAGGKVTRISSTFFGPGDDYCPQWHLLAMLKDGADGWEPKFSY